MFKKVNVPRLVVAWSCTAFVLLATETPLTSPAGFYCLLAIWSACVVVSEDEREARGGSAIRSTGDSTGDEGSSILLMCGRCYEEVATLYPPTCNERPETLKGAPLGQYHCSDCGAMVVAGIPHPLVCERCRDLKHPDFDLPNEGSSTLMVREGGG